ncbi:sodium:proton antiporter [Brasilonema octagenarum UFV-E1]|uniref:Sodium:proton antiporter n=1 Tax=Brasilonema sennae CENA114 TaxID=415709 RepID=A0A856MN73_9CYAN|nr:cation:proton antiporter [Brasilonema sennae]QDL11952.1 sodium:proton antiporter [Brasilonema sennae CENA114]QDL18327.1 sodium:proton antiporter [Brasilonema octagenarum UFV-E1]
MHLEPIVSFAILLTVILIVPLLFERFKLPGLIGLLIAGVALGPHGLHLLNTESETLKLLSDIGLVYLMFVAGLEIDMEQFEQTKHRSIGFGTFTFLVPLITGTIVGRMFGFGWNASVLIGSLFASHTLLAYPIISRLGVIKNEAVTVTIGATIFTDIGSLLVLAVCVAIHQGAFSTFSLMKLLLGLVIYSAVILFGFKWLGHEFFRRTRDEQGNQFLFILMVVFISALGAEVIGVEKIVGAFLAGLAVNEVIGSGPVKEKVVFVGNVLFIPIFFVDLGLLIDIPGFIKSISSVWLTLAILVGLIGSKGAAALLAKVVYRYNWQEMITMWSLSLPQVAATLAATLVGYRAGLLTEGVLNGVIVLMMVTATLGPLITARSAPGLITTDTTSEASESTLVWKNDPSQALTVVVPVRNPETERNLIEMAALLIRRESGRVVPLAVTPAHIHMDSPELENDIQQSKILLSKAVELGREFGVEVEPLVRIDQGIVHGINHASREQDANLIVMGWGSTTGIRARLFGNVIDSVLWASHCPVAVTRLLDSPSNIRSILVPIENLTQEAVRVVRFVEIFAQANQAEVTLLHVCARRTSPARVAWMESQLNLLVSKYFPQSHTNIKVLASDNLVNAILKASKSCDLVVLRSRRRRLNIGEVALSDVTTEIVRQIQCSVVLLGEPQGYQDNLSKAREVVKKSSPENLTKQEI